MYFNEIAVRAKGVGKVFRLYDRPSDRLKQLLFGKRRDYGRSFAALSDVSFELQKGKVLGVVGNNGAGKSTLLQLLCGTLSPTTGSVEVKGRIAALLELGAGFNPEFTGRENIFLNAAVLGLNNAEISRCFDAIVEFSGIGEFIDQPVKTYSSGMYVRLAFSIATAVEPEILVIDEALSVGDGAFARKSFDRIMQLREAGATILFCSHSMYHIEAICDQAIWLERGRVRMLGEPSVVTRAYGESLLDVSKSSVPVEADVTFATGNSSGWANIRSVVVEADGVSGGHLKLRSGISTLTVRVRFAFDPSLPMPSIAFGIDTDGGISVTSGSSLFDSAVAKDCGPGEGEIVLSFPNICLMKGSYRLSIFLACERTLHLYDHASQCAVLDVTHNGNERGVCFLPRVWSGQSVIHAGGAVSRE